MAQQTYTYNSQAELVLAMSGNELYGYTPAEKYDATTFKYPIKVTINKTAKTFTVKEVTEEKKDETKQETTTQPTTPSTTTESTKKTPVYKKAWFWGVIAAVVVVVIVAIVLAVCL